MTRLLLDTTFLIDAKRSGDGLDEVIADDDDVAIAAVTVAEIQVGVLLSSGKRRISRSAFVDEVVESLQVIAYDLAVAADHARLLAEVRESGRPRGAHDLIIAATAKTTSRVVVTADADAFAGLEGVEVRLHR